MVKKMKKTPLGLIPNDWKLDILEHCLKIQTGTRNTEDKQENGKYPFFVRSSKIEHIDTYHYDCEAVLTAGDGVGTGKVFHYINGKFDAHQRVYILTDFDGIEGKYFYYYFRENFLKEVSKYTAKSSVDSVRRDMIAKMVVPIPKLEEQTAIAEALSNIDSLIFSLQKLIEKKKAIKQGAMQELLTGKKRLPGFNEEWEELNFAESAKLKARIGWQGLTTSEYLQSGYAYLITGTDFHNGRIKWNTCHFVDEKRYKQDVNIQIKKHDILLTKDGTIGKVAYISDIPKPATLNSGVFVIRPAKEKTFDPNFVYHILNSFIFDNFLAKLSAGSTINHLYQKDFVDFKFKAPAELVEQQAIAQVLSDMDSEIEKLEKKLAKYQQIKQGMMQELLTGRIRLVDTDGKEQPQTQVAQEQQPQPTHNHHFDDAVMIAGIVNAFYSDRYPSGRKKVQKLLYLLRRKEQADISAFHKKAAGPYADEVR